QATDLLLRNYRTINRSLRDTDAGIKTSACYSINKEGGTERGCVMVPEGQSACQAVREQLGLLAGSDSDMCDICLTDKCNGSASLQVSLGAMILLLALGLKNLF
ncbi:hypothetical protein KR009_010051, partial [Drosophila setifemur]